RVPSSALRVARCAFVGLIATALALWVVGCQTQPPMDVFGPTPSFQLTDQTGATFASQSLGGKVTLLDFVYTHCTDACPLLSATLHRADPRHARRAHRPAAPGPRLSGRRRYHCRRSDHRREAAPQVRRAMHIITGEERRTQ